MSSNKTVLGAFNQGVTPTIACFNQSTVALGVDFDALVGALQRYVDEHVVPVWGTPARLVRSAGFLRNAWAIVLLDDADQPGALAYHDLTPGGLPLSKVFVKTTLEHGGPVGVSASHELVEMLVDPAINLLSSGPEPRTFYAYESADPVESLNFPVDGIPMSDFVYPAYFEAFRKGGAVKFDHLGKVQRPFQVLAGGYQIVCRNGKWSQVFGSTAKQRAFAREDRRGHRSETRRRGTLERTRAALAYATARRASTASSTVTPSPA
jgi:hypothetical protein